MKKSLGYEENILEISCPLKLVRKIPRTNVYPRVFGNILQLSPLGKDGIDVYNLNDYSYIGNTNEVGSYYYKEKLYGWIWEGHIIENIIITDPNLKKTSVALNTEGISGIASYHNNKVILNGKGILALFDLEANQFLWKTDFPTKKGFRFFGNNGVFFVLIIHDTVYCYDFKNGNLIWEKTTHDLQPIPNIEMTFSPPFILGNDLILCIYDGGKVVSLNLADGTPNWEHHSSFLSPNYKAAADRMLYGLGKAYNETHKRNGVFYSVINGLNGEPLFQTDIYEELIKIGISPDNLYPTYWEITYDHLFFFMRNSPFLLALNKHTAKIDWFYKNPPWEDGSDFSFRINPLIVDGRLFIINQAHELLIFEETK